MRNKLGKNISIIVLGFVSFVFSLTKYIMSYELYKDEYGTDISFNNDYFVAMLISLIILFCGVILLINFIKKEKNSHMISTYSGLIVSALVAFYPLGVLFKQLNKGKPFVDNLNYFFIGIVGLILLVYFVFSYLDKKQETK